MTVEVGDEKHENEVPADYPICEMAPIPRKTVECKFPGRVMNGSAGQVITRACWLTLLSTGMAISDKICTGVLSLSSYWRGISVL